MCSAWIHTGQGLGRLAAWISRSPKRLWTQLEFLKRNVLGYVCNPSSSRERDAAPRGHTSGIPASACFILEADAGCTACAFIPAGHDVTSPMTSRPSVGQISLVFRAGYAEGIPKASLDAAFRSLEELGLHT